MQPSDVLIRPEWPAALHVHAFASTRVGGVSDGPYASLNLGTHVGDEPADVANNRERLGAMAGLPARPRWLQQVHGNRVVELTGADLEEPADAAFTRTPGEICAVLTADCLPVLFTSVDGSVVAAAHAGWRGLAAGVLEATVAAMQIEPARLMAWLGPAIGPEAYEIDQTVHDAFVGDDAGAASAFRPVRAGHWYLDLYMLARRRLHAIGLNIVYGGRFCTYSEPDRFYSFRRDGECGRMATFIWLEP